MKKKIGVLVVAATTLTMLAGCEEATINYDGKEQKISAVEEIIADKLEVDNPELDLEVNISEETED